MVRLDKEESTLSSWRIAADLRNKGLRRWFFLMRLPTSLEAVPPLCLVGVGADSPPRGLVKN